MIPNFLKDLILEPNSYDLGPFPYSNGILTTDELLLKYSDLKNQRASIIRTSYEKNIWKVYYFRECLSKDLEWVYESQPSSRTEDFLEKTRFSSPEEALLCYKKFLEKIYSEEGV